MNATCSDRPSISMIGRAALKMTLLWLALTAPFLAPVVADDESRKVRTAEEAARAKAQAATDEKREAGKKADPTESAKGEADAKGDGKKEGQQPVRNPLTDLIKRSLTNKGAPAEAAGAKPANSGDAPPTKRAGRNASDQRAPYDKRADDWMRKAVAHVKAVEWQPALELLQKISELPEDSLFRTESGKWVSLRGEAQRLRGTAPGEMLEQYRVQFGGLARQLLLDAMRSGDLAGFGRVAGTYFHTDAGYDAANRLGSLHLDRGEFALAAHWFAALWQARAAVTRDPLWRAKAAFVLKQAGQTELSQEVFDESLAAATTAIGLGGKSHEPGKWLAAAPHVSGPEEPSLSDWPLFFGTPRRTGVATGGEPLLLPRWRLAATDSHPVRAQIEHLTEDLADQGSPALPMLFPTMVGGKVIYRTLHGVQVVDAASGRPLWQTDESLPLERLIAGTAGPFDGGMAGGAFNGIAMMGRGIRMWNNNAFYNGVTGEQSPLANLLFRNANFGIVSSDGQQLFVLDDPQFLTNRQPGNIYGFDGTNSVATAPCRLSAYALETGRPQWEIGGPANGEPFDLPLAGYFFFGAPVADGAELFVIGESTAGDTSGQIRLVCLDPQTGEKKWSQLVAASEVAIEKDVGRRWLTAQVASGDGILVCPTTVGWLVAVDRVTHSLLWGYRSPVPKPQNNPGNFGDNEASQMVPYAPFGGGWSCAPPIIAEGRIIYTPPEAQVLVCLDEFTGKELWNKPRGNSLYLAGVFEKQVVVVGRDAVTAYQIENGAQAWTTAISTPSGRGVTVADRLYLPLAAGEVWSLDLKTGAIGSKWNLPSHVPSVGNLAMYRGMLLAVDAFGLTAFEQRDAVQAEIVARKQQNPRDPWALIREAEISVLSRNSGEALSLLKQVPRDAIPAELRESFRTLLLKVLTETIRADYRRSDTDADLRDLAGLVRTAEDQQELQRLRAELHMARGEYEAAFDAYLGLADDPQLLVPRDDIPGVRVRSDLWVAGKLDDLRQSVAQPMRETIDLRIAALRTKAENSEAARRRFIVLFRNHPEAAVVRRQLAEALAQRGEFLPAEHLLTKLSRGDNPTVAGEALDRLARLMLEFKLPADAAWYYHELEQRFGTVAVKDGRTGAQIVQALREAGNFPDAPPPVLDWHADALRVERLGAVYSQHVPQELSSIGSQVPFFSTHRFEIEIGTSRLEVIDGMSDEIHWSLPLRVKANTPEGGLAFAQASGHHLTILHRGVIHSVSPVDRRILWTRLLDNRGAGQQFYGRNTTPLVALQAAVALTNRPPVFQGMQVAPGTGLGLANEDFVSYQGRRSITVLDALTGEVCWTCTGVRPGTTTLGGDNVVYLRPPDRQNPLALRASDGRRLEVPKLAATVNASIHAVRDSFVLASLAEGKPGLRLYNPITDRDLWSLPLDKSAVMTLLENDRLAVLETASGNFRVIDLPSGQHREMGTISPDDLKGRTELYALSDNLNIYLVINKGQNPNYYSESVPFVRTSGLILAFDAATGKQRWKQPVQGQNLMLERLNFSPFLVFTTRKYEQKGKLQFWSLQLLALDKLTGTRLLDEKTGNQQGFRSVNVNATDRYVELRSYNERVRLYPVEKSATAGQSGG